MGQFKPMVKMMTTEPTVELKLKKGGAVMMKKGGKAVKKMDGGALGAMSGTPALIGRPAVNAPVRSPMRPTMTARRKAMAVRPMGRTMKEGGETEKEHKEEAKKMASTEKKLEKHASMPASKAHKGLKTGGVAKGQGGYATGGVVYGQGGYKHGGKIKKYAKGGIITEQEGSKDAGPYKNTLMHTAKPDRSPAKTGSVRLGNAGGYKSGGMAQGMQKPQKEQKEQMKQSYTSADDSYREEGKGFAYKKGGAAKKYANGGSVNDSGKAVNMPQGQKKPSTPVSINQLSGTFKNGGKVMTPAEKRLTKTFDKENAPAMKAAKADSNEVYSKYGKMKMRSGGMC